MRKQERIDPQAVKAPWEMAEVPKETPVLLALSGGADSRALLHLLAAQAGRDGFSLSVAHIHHGIRGADADRDAAFCRRLAEAYGCAFYLHNADVPGLAAARGQSLEWAAREVRYAFLERVMREQEIPLLVTAHHADDNLETVLFRMARGAALQGLCGIFPVRAFANGRLVRPLLPYTRREIRDYCAEEHLEFVQDATNEEAICARNRLRLEAIPVLERVAGEPQRSAWRMTQALAQDLDYLNTAARDFYGTHMTERGISVSALQAAHPAIRARVWSLLCPCDLETVHMDALERLASVGRSGARCPLPNRLVVCVQGGFLSVLPDLRVGKQPVKADFGEGILTLCDGMLIVCVTKSENSEELRNVHNLSTHKCIIIERVGLHISDAAVWRTRRDGDVMRQGGRTRLLADLYREAAVPPMLRDAIPVLEKNGELAWAPFVGAQNACRDDTEVCYRVEIYLADPEAHRKDRDVRPTK